MSNSKKKSEQLIKEILLEHLLRKDESNNDFAITEFGVANFTRRVDVVASNNKNFYAFEIKSENDSLHRLDGQLTEYLNHFDKVIVVAAEKHIPNILLKAPFNVGVWEIKDSKLKVIRPGRTIRIKDKIKFLKMMTLSELVFLSKKMGVYSHKNRRNEFEALLIKLPVYILRNEALTFIKERYKKRATNYFDYSIISKSDWNMNKNIKISSEANSNFNSIDYFIQALDNLKIKN